MYVLLFILVEYLVFVHILPVYVTLCAFLVYMLWYFDGKEYTGERRWEFLRSLRVWQWVSPVHCVFPNKSDIGQTRGKRLFIVPMCLTPSPLIWGIGLHGGTLVFNQPVHYVVPPIYMWIPFMRDFLMWTGAVTYSLANNSRSKQKVVQDLLDDGRVVAYSPSNFFNPHDHDLEAIIEHRYPTDEMFRYCMNESVSLIPIMVQGEQERYHIVHKLWLRTAQKWFYAKIEYALPLCYWFKIWNRRRPPPVTLKVGPSITCNLYTTQTDGLEKLRKSVKETVGQLGEPVRIGVVDKGDKDT